MYKSKIYSEFKQSSYSSQNTTKESLIIFYLGSKLLRGDNWSWGSGVGDWCGIDTT
jgi:hypothetical protein